MSYLSPYEWRDCSSRPLGHGIVTLLSAVICYSAVSWGRYFRCLQHGTVPVVIGAPNIQDFAPAPNSIIHIATKEEIPL
jgi:hypothetical protein